METVCTDFSYCFHRCVHPDCHSKKNLASDGVDRARRFLDLRGKAGDHQEHDHGKESREKSRETVVEATVLLDTNNLVDRPSDEVQPRDRSREGEARNNGVQGLRLEFLSQERDGFHGSSRHCIYITYVENYSGSSSSSDKIFLYRSLSLEYPFVT